MHPFDTVGITHLPTSLTLRPPNAIAKWISYYSSVFVSVLLCGQSWTTQSPNNTSKRERSILGRRSQVMSPNTFSIIWGISKNTFFVPLYKKVQWLTIVECRFLLSSAFSFHVCILITKTPSCLRVITITPINITKTPYVASLILLPRSDSYPVS